MSLELISAHVTYPGASEPALRGVSLSFLPGTHTALLGPNGAGKSTVLRLLAGLLTCDEGQAQLEGTSARRWRRRDFARLVAFVSSTEEAAFPIRVRDYVFLGRNPYLHGWRSAGEADTRSVDEALARTDMRRLEGRYLSSLSAGELQRARIARALAQEPEILLLDEPTAHLDLGHEFAIFELLAELTAQLSLTAVNVTHNINMASRFCGRVVLLSRGRVVADGSAETVLIPSHIEKAFDWPVETVDRDGLGIVAVPVSRIAAPGEPG